MNVIVELGPADVARLRDGMAVARAGIVVVQVGHPLVAKLSTGMLLVLDEAVLDLVERGGTYRAAGSTGELVDVRRVPR